MRTTAECIPCFLRQTAESLAMVGDMPVNTEIILRRVLRELAYADWSASPPAIAQMLHRIIREESGNTDPYLSLKDRMNHLTAGGPTRQP